MQQHFADGNKKISSTIEYKSEKGWEIPMGCRITTSVGAVTIQ